MRSRVYTDTGGYARGESVDMRDVLAESVQQLKAMCIRTYQKDTFYQHLYTVDTTHSTQVKPSDVWRVGFVAVARSVSSGNTSRSILSTFISSSLNSTLPNKHHNSLSRHHVRPLLSQSRFIHSYAWCVPYTLYLLSIWRLFPQDAAGALEPGIA